MKIGLGYDLHRFIDGKPLVIGGVKIPNEKGLKGHSDGDVLLHALSDAIFGASASRDIGYYFPDTDPACKGMDSRKILRKALDIMREKGFAIGNMDCVIICDEPKIGTYRDAICQNLANLLGVGVDSVNIKGKTTEGSSQQETAACHVVVLLEKTINT